MERQKINQPNDLVNEILKELWGDSYNDVFNDSLNDNIHPTYKQPGVYREIELPDNFPGKNENIEDIEIGEIKNDQEKTNKKVLILAYYSPMIPKAKRPGQITYCINNIKHYYAVLLRRYFRDKVKGRNLLKCEVITILRIVVSTIYLHELFHYFSDYHFNINKRKYDYLIEEALANAFAYKLLRNFTMSSESNFSVCFHQLAINISIYDVRDLIFNNITLPGYKDYFLYVNDNDGIEDNFNLKCFDYLTNEGMRDTVTECGFPKNNYWRELYMKYAINFDTNGLVYYIEKS